MVDAMFRKKNAGIQTCGKNKFYQNQNLPTIKDENIHPCGIVSPLVLLCGWESKIETSDFTSLQVMELIINLNIITVEKRGEGDH